MVRTQRTERGVRVAQIEQMQNHGDCPEPREHREARHCCETLIGGHTGGTIERAPQSEEGAC
ncbi:unannotated protein [freshwater metagenome]|uniref:Unannotated protein n=1 Tax=freshwater metagenome TaxID=449393 RepID=A0A6J6GHZ2_9ZZZZ